MTSAFTVIAVSTASTENKLFDHSEKLGIYEDDVNPESGEEGVELDENMQTNLSVRVRHDDEEKVNVTFYGNESGEDLKLLGKNCSVPHKGYANLTVDTLNFEFGTEYEWYVNITEYGNKTVYNETDIFTFKTEEILIEVHEPVHEEVGIYDEKTANLSVTVDHPDDEDVNVTFYGNESGEDLGMIGTKNSVPGDGVSFANFTWDVEYGTEYKWYVEVYEAYDREYFSNETDLWKFTTEEVITEIQPEDEAVRVELNEDMDTMLKVNVTHPDGKDMNVTFLGNETGEKLEPIYNETVEGEGWANISWENLTYGTEYTWFINITYGEDTDLDVLLVSDNWTFTTEYIPWKVREPNYPKSGAENISLDSELNVIVGHPENKNLTVTFYGNETDEDLSGNDENEIYNETVESGENVKYVWEGLDFGTTYYWQVNVSEENTNWTLSEVWNFTTRDPELTLDIEGDGKVLVEYSNFSKEYNESETLRIEENTEIWLNATPEENSYFEEWLINDITDETTNITILMDDDKNITAHFEEKIPWFEVEITDYEEDIVVDGTLSIEFTVENTGESQDTQDILFKVDDAEEDSVEIGLEPGDTYTDEFFWNATEVGEFEFVVSSEDTSDSVILTVEEPLEAYFEIEITDYNREVGEGEYVMVEFTVKNSGDGEGTQDITFSVEGREVDRKEDLTLEAGEERTDKFFWQADAGSHLLTVASEDDDDTVAVNVHIDTEEVPGFTSFLLVSSVILAVVIYHKKKE